MRRIAIVRIIGAFCMGFSVTMLAPLIVSLIYSDGEWRNILESAGLVLATGLALWLVGRGSRVELRARDGFMVVALFWIVLSALAAAPFILSTRLSPVDGLFEAASAFTTTGATVMTGLDDLPPSVLFYRQQLQWFGGMGLIVLAVAVLPMLGIGGAQLYRAETPGPMKEDRLAPRMAQSARTLWLLYLGFTVVCALAYWGAGMTPFDAIAHSLSTVSTGGFSTHDDSLGYFDSPTIETIAIVFMLAGSINFSVHYLAWSSGKPAWYLRDVEVRSFLLFVVAVILLATATLYIHGDYPHALSALRDVSFEVVSVVTSTGFGTVDFSHWPIFLPVLLIYISFVGGCGGSTAGGMKVLRVLLVVRQGYLELLRLIHPKASLLIKIGGRTLPERTIQGVWGFFAAYVATFAILMLCMMAVGLDQISAFSAIATCMNNLGPGLGTVAYNFAAVPDAGKLLAVLAMLLGRLEIFTLLVVVSPVYWRQ